MKQKIKIRKSIKSKKSKFTSMLEGEKAIVRMIPVPDIFTLNDFKKGVKKMSSSAKIKRTKNGFKATNLGFGGGEVYLEWNTKKRKIIYYRVGHVVPRKIEKETAALMAERFDLNGIADKIRKGKIKNH